MTAEQVNRVREWFLAHVRQFADPSGELHAMIQLKLNHSFRVCADALEIARDLGWDESHVRTAECLGLLHDCARFPQYHEFRTFSDQRSFDHGEKAYDIVCEQDPISDLAAPLRRSVLTGIRYHNRRRIPDEVTGLDLAMTRLVRDADKVDIMFVISDAILNDRIKDYPEITLHIDTKGPPTEALVREILDHRAGSYQNVHTLADMNLLRLCWVYDINYLPTIRRMLDRGLYADICRTIPDTPDIRRIKESIGGFMHDLVDRGEPVLHPTPPTP